jgi:hypothetical protein
MENTKSYTILLLLRTTPEWLRLNRKQRSYYFDQQIKPIFREVSNTVSIRLYDSEYYHASISDFMIIQTNIFEDYQLFLERLRDTAVYGVPYFEVKDIIIGEENLFEKFNERFEGEVMISQKTKEG